MEQELVPAAAHLKLGVLPYFPLASSLLTGKYRKGRPAPDGTRLSDALAGRRWMTDANLALAEKLEAFARERGHSLLELAIGWLAGQPIVPSVIAGATRREQVEANVAAASWKLSDQERAEVERIAQK